MNEEVSYFHSQGPARAPNICLARPIHQAATIETINLPTVDAIVEFHDLPAKHMPRIRRI
jgi:hypothetical protein